MIDFTLILCTINRDFETISAFLESIEGSVWQGGRFEIVIVDQNKDKRIRNGLAKNRYKNVSYFQVPFIGLSKSRNYGLEKAKGRYVGFPDDDCLYYPDTLSKVYESFERNNCDFVVGRIFDREAKKNVIKPWPQSDRKVTSHNFYFLSSSITMFFDRERCDLRFDPLLGAGGKFGSCEDPDLIFRLLKRKKRGWYSSSLQVWHPELPFEGVSKKRVISYGEGFWAFVIKNRSLVIFLLALAVTAWKLIRILKNPRSGASNFALFVKASLSVLSQMKRGG